MDAKKLLDNSKTSSCVFLTDGGHIDENFYYSTHLSKASQISGTVIVTREENVILTNPLEYKLLSGSGKLIIIKSRKDAEHAMKKYTGHTVGMDFSSISALRLSRMKKILKGKKIKNISEYVGELRAIKSNAEIKKIKEACKITETALENIGKLVKKCRTEKDIALELEYVARKNGAESAAFQPIVASGKNSALPHHLPGNVKLSKGILLIDFGVVYDGYCSDLTRVFHIGKCDEKSKYIYQIVYSAQHAAMEQMNEGTNAIDVHNAADGILYKQLNQHMIHSLGHGLGIDVHDFPQSINSKSLLLRKNMVLTAEPGYYRNGWGGIRIEDDIVVGSQKRLSKAPSTITEV